MLLRHPRNSLIARETLSILTIDFIDLSILLLENLLRIQSEVGRGRILGLKVAGIVSRYLLQKGLYIGEMTRIKFQGTSALFIL